MLGCIEPIYYIPYTISPRQKFPLGHAQSSRNARTRRVFNLAISQKSMRTTACIWFITCAAWALARIWIYGRAIAARVASRVRHERNMSGTSHNKIKPTEPAAQCRVDHLICTFRTKVCQSGKGNAPSQIELCPINNCDCEWHHYNPAYAYNESNNLISALN